MSGVRRHLFNLGEITSHECNRRSQYQRSFYDPQLLFRRSSNPLLWLQLNSDTCCFALTISIKARMQTVYTASSRRLLKGYSSISLSTQSISSSWLMRDQESQPIVATATVTNTGKRRATEIAQCYISIREATSEQPVRNLKGFIGITLDPGQTPEHRCQ